MFVLLEQHPLLLLALLLLLGSLLGQIKIVGVQLGAAAVLFVAIGVTAWGTTQEVTLTIPEILGNFGLMVFTYTVGITSGPSFFGSLKRGWPVMLVTIAALGIAAVSAFLVGRGLNLPTPVIAGTFAGALTNTPALAAAGQAAGDAELPAVGYSISYLWGVIGMMLASGWVLAKGARESKPARAQRLEQRTIRLDRIEPVTVAELLERHHHESLTITRVRHGSATAPTVVASPEEVLATHDLISVVAPPATMAALIKELGHVSSHDIIGDRTHLDSNRVTLSVASMAGKHLDELELDKRFGAHVSRVRRGDLDMVPDHDFVVQMGDRLRIVAPRDQMAPIRRYLGDSERGFADINPSGFALGLLIGIAIGMIPIPLPTGTFVLGTAAGTLIAGLVFGRLGHLGPLPITMSSPAAHALSNFGMLVFLAFAGSKAGLLFAEAVTSEPGLADRGPRLRGDRRRRRGRDRPRAGLPPHRLGATLGPVGRNPDPARGARLREHPLGLRQPRRPRLRAGLPRGDDRQDPVRPVAGHPGLVNRTSLSWSRSRLRVAPSRTKFRAQRCNSCA
ncbi:MAG: TrkA C-terminal domain-containing protein [Propioniciclava sp.]